MEGPREVRSQDMGSLRELTDTVMRVGLVDQYPQLFNPDNYENLRICLDGDKVVSHVGMTLRDATLFGCRIRVALIGGVCTYPEYRKRGLASACFDDAFRKARGDGADIMIVSGDRNLYRMRGCVHVGGDLEFTIARGAIPAGMAELSPRVTVEIMHEDELPLVEECYRAEPVRFERPSEDYRFAIDGGWVMSRPSDFLVIRRDGDFAGYAIAPRYGKDGSARPAEFAGDRDAVLAAISHILDRYNLSSVALHVMRHDSVLRALCERAGLVGSHRSTPGTVTLVNFPQLMERTRPYLARSIGAATAARLRFHYAGDLAVFALDGEEIELDRSEAMRLLFGTRDGPPEIAVDITSPLGDALRAALPLPTLWYGINYV